jgi:hypothetical protein
MLSLLALTACGPGSTWLDGTWQIASWSVVVGDPASPSVLANFTDAGQITFSGSGAWWESDAFYEGPDIVRLDAGDYEVIDQSAWTYWALQDGAIWLAWAQDYAKPEVLVPDTPRESSFRATSAREIVEVDGIRVITTDWQLERGAR